MKAFDLKEVSFYIGDSKCKILSKIIFLFRVRSSSLEKGIKGLKRREKFESENF